MNTPKRQLYWKLLPEEPTPADELCECEGDPALKLMTAHSSNPIHCMECGRERPLEKVDLTERQFEKIYFWHQVYRSVYTLWLDSNEYEEWSSDELENPASYANRKGLEILPDLNQRHRFYFHLFQRVHDEDWQAPSACPICAGRLVEQADVDRPDLLCDPCSIVMQSG